MSKFLFDSGILSAYLDRRGAVHATALRRRAEGHRIGTCYPIVAEIASGLERSASRARNLSALRRSLATLKLWPFDEDAAFEYGRIHAELIRRGRPMQTMDILLAAVAFALPGGVVVTTDSDLSAIPGLDVENWAVPTEGTAP